MKARRIREPGMGLIYEIECDCWTCRVGRPGLLCEDITSFIGVIYAKQPYARFVLVALRDRQEAAA